MSWLLFLDESGHDHGNTPYEVHGGFAIHSAKLWPFISSVRTLEQSVFGADLREYLVFLLERFFYFLESKREMGLLVMDGTEKSADHRIVRQMERYFTLTRIGRQRTQWIVPVPFFVESDMAYGVQAADLCIYCLNWGCRLMGMTEPTRPEIEPFVWLLEKFIWRGEGYRDGAVYRSHGVCYVPDLYGPRTRSP